MLLPKCAVIQFLASSSEKGLPFPSSLRTGSCSIFYLLLIVFGHRTLPPASLH
jgi:hypothetical protein